MGIRKWCLGNDSVIKVLAKWHLVDDNSMVVEEISRSVVWRIQYRTRMYSNTLKLHHLLCVIRHAWCIMNNDIFSPSMEKQMGWETRCQRVRVQTWNVSRPLDTQPTMTAGGQELFNAKMASNTTVTLRHVSWLFPGDFSEWCIEFVATKIRKVLQGGNLDPFCCTRGFVQVQMRPFIIWCTLQNSHTVCPVWLHLQYTLKKIGR